MTMDLQAFWQFVLVTVPGGQALTVGKLITVVALVIGGYFLSKFIGYLLGVRLAATRLNKDVAHTIKRIAFFTLLVGVILTALSLLGCATDCVRVRDTAPSLSALASVRRTSSTISLVAGS